MLLLKVSYCIAFASAAVCGVLVFGLGDFSLVAPTIGGFIGGSLIAGIDRIVELISPKAPLAAALPAAKAADRSNVTMTDLGLRLASAKARITA